MIFPDLLSAVIHLQPSRRTAYISEPLGHKVQGWFMDLVHNRMPGYPRLLHGDTAYTLSGLQPQPAGFPGSYFIRITSLSAQVSQLIHSVLLPNLPRTLVLHPYEFRVLGAAVDASEHPWAGQEDYLQLWEASRAAGHAANGRLLTLQFATPTAFRNRSLDLPLPVPEKLYASYARKWDRYSPLGPAPEGFNAFARDASLVTRLDELRIRPWVLPDTHPALGFTGTLGLELLVSKKLREALQPAGLLDTYQHIWRLLADYAFYCGTGHHSTSGMGQTRPL